MTYTCTHFLLWFNTRYWHSLRSVYNWQLVARHILPWFLVKGLCYQILWRWLYLSCPNFVCVFATLEKVWYNSSIGVLGPKNWNLLHPCHNKQGPCTNTFARAMPSEHCFPATLIDRQCNTLTFRSAELFIFCMSPSWFTSNKYLGQCILALVFYFCSNFFLSFFQCTNTKCLLPHFLVI